MPAVDQPEFRWRFPNIPESRWPRKCEEWSIDTDYFTSTDGFSMRFYDPDPERLLGLELEPVELLLDDAQQLLGRVDTTVNNGDGTLEVQGRDYLADMVECNIDPTFAVKKDETLGDTVSRAAAPVGIKVALPDSDAALRNVRSGVAVGSPSPKTFNALRLSDYKPSPGQGIYDFLNKICARHGCTIQPTENRAWVMLSAPHYDQPPIGRIVRSRTPATSASNVIKQATAARDFSSFPTFTLFVGKGIGAGGSTEDIRVTVPIADYIGAGATGAELRAIVNERSVAGRVLPKDGRDADGQLYRLLYFKDENAKNLAQLERGAWRAIGERMRDTLVYEVTVQGHRDWRTGAIWTPDTVIDVSDEMTGVTEPLWVAARRLQESSGQGGGKTTTLRMWRPYSILLETE